MIQKFFRGQRVRIAKDLGSSMSHFQANCEAIVLGSYNDEYGGGHKGRQTQYTLLVIPPKGKPYACAWYWQGQLKLVSDARRKGEDFIQKYG